MDDGRGWRGSKSTKEHKSGLIINSEEWRGLTIEVSTKGESRSMVKGESEKETHD